MSRTLALVLLCAFVTPAAAQTAPVQGIAAAPAALETAAALEQAVRAELAARWDVEPARVALHWLAAPPVLPAASFRLDGGTGGTWLVAVLDAHGRTTASLRVRGGVIMPRHVAARPLARGTLLSLDDIITRDTVRWGAPVAAPIAPEGWVARRTIAVGEPLLEPAVSAPDAVTAGSSVQLVYESSTIRVTANATALGSAPLGGRIGIRLESGRRVEAIVTAPGEVRLRTERK